MSNGGGERGAVSIDMDSVQRNQQDQMQMLQQQVCSVCVCARAESGFAGNWCV